MMPILVVWFRYRFMKDTLFIHQTKIDCCHSITNPLLYFLMLIQLKTLLQPDFVVFVLLQLHPRFILLHSDPPQ